MTSDGGSGLSPGKKEPRTSIADALLEPQGDDDAGQAQPSDAMLDLSKSIMRLTKMQQQQLQALQALTARVTQAEQPPPQPQPEKVRAASSGEGMTEDDIVSEAGQVTRSGAKPRLPAAMAATMRGVAAKLSRNMAVLGKTAATTRNSEHSFSS